MLSSPMENSVSQGTPANYPAGNGMPFNFPRKNKGRPGDPVEPISSKYLMHKILWINSIVIITKVLKKDSQNIT